MKICKKCGVKAELSAFPVDRSRPSGRHPYCSECNRKGVSKWRDTYKKSDISAWRKHERERARRFRATHPEYTATARKNRSGKIAEEISEYRRRHPERLRAQWAVSNALRRGKLKKQPCEVCGAKRVDAHHYLGYLPEHRLDVKWLCRMHHMAEDRVKK